MDQLASEMSKVAGRKVTAIEAAQGVLVIANTNMERALRRISVERGYDSREFALLPFGGAGGLHAVELAQALRIPRIIVPKAAGALSAIGVLTADVVKDQSHTMMLDVSRNIEATLDKTFKEMERAAVVTLRGEGFPTSKQLHERSLAMRYTGQSFELQIKWTGKDLATSFHRAHEARYGYAQESNIVEVVSTRVRSTGMVEKLSQQKSKAGSKKHYAKPSREMSAYLNGKKVRVAVYKRDELSAGRQLHSPCIVTEYSSTTLISPSATAAIDSYGNLIIQVR
jgi:N-methylhydantoinase A